MDRNRPMTAERIRPRTQSRLIAKQTSDFPPPDPVIQDHLTELYTEPISGQAVPPEELKEGEIKEDSGEEVLSLERPATATTWKTTTSQRRYIDELERLLKEERKVSAR